MREIKQIIIHCSDSPDEQNIGFKEIDRWHSARWSGILVNGRRIHCGYHYIIRRNGTVEMGRPESFIGSHVRGHNAHSIGICWVGRRQITEAQMASMLMLIEQIRERYNLSVSAVVGHRELDQRKTCPNLKMDDLRRMLGAEMGNLA